MKQTWRLFIVALISTYMCHTSVAYQQDDYAPAPDIVQHVYVRPGNTEDANNLWHAIYTGISHYNRVNVTPYPKSTIHVYNNMMYNRLTPFYACVWVRQGILNTDIRDDVQ